MALHREDGALIFVRKFVTPIQNYSASRPNGPVHIYCPVKPNFKKYCCLQLDVCPFRIHIIHIVILARQKLRLGQKSEIIIWHCNYLGQLWFERRFIIVSIVTRSGLDSLKVRVRLPVGEMFFSVLKISRTLAGRIQPCSQ
jgi:hypothetical protein